MNCIIVRERERPLFNILTTDVLSVRMRIDFLDHSCHQRKAVMTMGYSSNKADEGECDSESRQSNSGGQAEENYLPP